MEQILPVEQILPDETLDDLLLQGLRLIQKKKNFRFTLDSVLLAHFATLKEGDKVVDLGTGSAVIPLILSTRIKKACFWGVELQPDLAEMAARSVSLNLLTDRITIIEGDIKDVHRKLGGGIYTLVTSNPPYWSLGKGLLSTELGEALSRHEIACCLEDVVASASKLLNYQGRFAFIYRTAGLADTFNLLRKYKLEIRRIRFIHAFADKPARLVLLEARKQAPADLQVMPPLVVYETQGRYTEEIRQWYAKEEHSVE